MESVMDMARGAFGADTLARLSSWLGESPAGTKAAVQDALPVSLVGLANQAGSEEGSRELLTRFQRGDYPHLEPDEIGRAMNDPAASDRLVQSSQGFMGNLFGGKLGSIIEGMSEHTGVSRSAISKLMSLAAPLVMGLIGKRAVSDHLDAGGLRRYLGEQKNLAASLLPGSLSKLLVPAGATAAATMAPRAVPVATSHAAATMERRKAFPWWIVGLLAVAALLAFAWNRLSRRNVAPQQREVSAQLEAPSASIAVGNIAPLTRVIEGSGPLPQRMLLKDLTFATDSANMDLGSRQVLDEVAAVLIAHPKAKVRVEGHTDSTGMADANRQLSQARAESTRRYLVDRGVDAGRIEAMGYGADRPIATNDTTAGRTENRRTELVVTAR